MEQALVQLLAGKRRMFAVKYQETRQCMACGTVLPSTELSTLVLELDPSAATPAESAKRWRIGQTDGGCCGDDVRVERKINSLPPFFVARWHWDAEALFTQTVIAKHNGYALLRCDIHLANGGFARTTDPCVHWQQYGLADILHGAGVITGMQVMTACLPLAPVKLAGLELETSQADFKADLAGWANHSIRGVSLAAARRIADDKATDDLVTLCIELAGQARSDVTDPVNICLTVPVSAVTGRNVQKLLDAPTR